jgi:hypothetical protein
MTVVDEHGRRVGRADARIGGRRVLRAVDRFVERAGHVPDHLTVLNRRHTARRERATVAVAVDGVHDRRLGIAGSQVVAV